MTASPCWRNTCPKRQSPLARPTLNSTPLQSARPSSISACTFAGSPWELKSTSTNPKSDQAVPLLCLNSLKSARLSSVSEMALAYSSCRLTTHPKLTSDQAIPSLSSTSLKSAKASSVSEYATARLPLNAAIAPSRRRERAIPAVSPSSRHRARISSYSASARSVSLRTKARCAAALSAFTCAGIATPLLPASARSRKLHPSLQ